MKLARFALFFSITVLVWACLAPILRANVPSSTSWVQYTTTTLPQTMTVPFVFQNASDILVLDSKTSPPVTLTLNSDYSVSGGGGSTGTVSTISGGSHGVAAGDVITISRSVPITQTTTFSNGGPLTASMVGQAFDKAASISQQLNLVGARSLQFQPDENPSGVLPLSSRKSALLGFDANGNVQFYPTQGIFVSTIVPVQVNTVALLEAMPVTSVTNGQVVTLGGYYAIGDGGGGLVYYNSTSTATVDNGLVFSTASGTGRYLRIFYGAVNVRWFGAKGDGANADNVPIEAAIVAATALGAATYIPAPPTAYNIAAAIELPSNAVVYGDGYATVLSSSQTGTFQFMRQTGFNSNTAQSNITVRGMRFLRTNAMAGTEGPYDGAIELTYSTKLLVEDCQFYSSMTGVHFYECTDWEARGCVGYSQGDITVRVNTDGTNPSAKRGVVQDCHSENAGFALDGTTPVPTPGGPVGSSFLTTQSDTAWFNITITNSRFFGFEVGGSLTGLLIDGYNGYASASGRSVGLNMTDVSHATLRNITLVCSNQGQATINGQNMNYCEVENVVKKDLYVYTVVGSGLDTVHFGNNSTHNRMVNITSYGTTCAVLDGTGADNVIQNCMAVSAPKQGFSLATQARATVTNCIAIDCGYNTNEISGDRLGFRIDGMGTGFRFVDNVAYDSRSAGARTQEYGFYVNEGAGSVWRNNVATNNIAGALTVTGSPTLTSDVVAVTSPIAYVKAGTISDADFPMTPTDGTVGIDSTDGRIYVRSGGSWIYFAKTGP